MKNNINAAMTLNSEKQQPYNNESDNEKQEWKTTIVQRSYNNRSTMKKQSNTRMKHDNRTQQRKTTKTHSNDTQQ